MANRNKRTHFFLLIIGKTVPFFAGMSLFFRQRQKREYQLTIQGSAGTDGQTDMRTKETTLERADF